MAGRRAPALLLLRGGLAVAHGDERLQLQETLLTDTFYVHQLFEIFLDHSQLNIHRGELEVRPPAAPTSEALEEGVRDGSISRAVHQPPLMNAGRGCPMK
jgi:hypothetical protein